MRKKELLIISVILVLCCAACTGTKQSLRPDFWDLKGLRIAIGVEHYTEPSFDTYVDLNFTLADSKNDTSVTEAQEDARLAGDDISTFLKKFSDTMESEIRNYNSVMDQFAGRLENNGYIVKKIDTQMSRNDLIATAKKENFDFMLLFSITSYGLAYNSSISEDEVDIFIIGGGRLVELGGGGIWWSSEDIALRRSTDKLGPFKQNESGRQPWSVEYSSAKEAEIARQLERLTAKLVSNLVEDFGFTSRKANRRLNIESPLLSALQNGNIEEAQKFIERGEYISLADNSGTTPLHLAISKGYPELALMLVENANVNAGAVNDELQTPLHLACDLGYLDIIEGLFKRGVKIDAVDKSGRTPLHYAAFEGHFNIVRFLLEEKANLKLRDVWGYTPKDYALMQDNTNIAAFLDEMENE